MYKVFINDKPVIFSQTILHGEHNDFEIMNENKQEIKNIISNPHLLRDKRGIIIYSDDESLSWDLFCKNFLLIEAAGGLARNQKKELLMIYRFDKWDLPKGKIEKGESLEEAALREVCEETGVCDVTILNKEGETFHTYLQNKKPILKKTHWFNMQCIKFSEFSLQKEEDIQQAEWMDKKKINVALKNSYASIVDILKSYA